MRVLKVLLLLASTIVLLTACGSGSSGGGGGNVDSVNVSGDWTNTFSGDDVKYMTLTQSGNDISGSTILHIGNHGTFSGSVNGTDISLLLTM